MTAAETGHLVLGTLHTTSASKTIDRIIDALPVDEREQTKSFLSHSLLAVVTQILVKTADNARAQGDLRNHGHEPRDRQAHPDRPDAPDSRPAADRQGPRHADHGSGAAQRAGRARKSIPTTPYRYATDRKKFERFVTDTTVLPKLDVTGPTDAIAGRWRLICRSSTNS